MADKNKDRARRRQQRLTMDNAAVQRRIEAASSFFLAESSNVVEAPPQEKPAVMKPKAANSWKRAQRHTFDSAQTNKVFMSPRPSTPRHRQGATTSFHRESSCHSSTTYSPRALESMAKSGAHDQPGGTATDESAKKTDVDSNDGTSTRVSVKPAAASAAAATGFNFFRNPLKAADGVDVVVTSSHAKQAVDGLGLTQKDLRRLKKIFDEVDTEHTGSVSTHKLLVAMNEKPNAFSEKVFASLDLNDNGKIEFEEFLRMLATYGMFSESDLSHFVFELMNFEGDGNFSEKDFAELMKIVTVVSPGRAPKSWASVTKHFDKNNKGYLTKHEFEELEKQFPKVDYVVARGPSLLSRLLFDAVAGPHPVPPVCHHPQVTYFANRLQENMHTFTLGDKFFARVRDRQRRAMQLEEYKITHNGALPKEHPLQKLMAKVCVVVAV